MPNAAILPTLLIILSSTSAFASTPSCSYKSLPGGGEALSRISEMVQESVNELLASKSVVVSRDAIRIKLSTECSRVIPPGQKDLNWQDTYKYKVKVDATVNTPKGGILVMDTMSFSCNGSTISKAYDEKGTSIGKSFYDVFFLSDYGFGPYEVKNTVSNVAIGSLEEAMSFQKMVAVYGKM